MPILKQGNYPEVRHAHIVPEMYLRNFGVRGLVREHPLDTRHRVRDRSVRKVATREYFYRRTRPGDGTTIDDVEASLGYVENHAARLVQNFHARWPFEGQDRVVVASFLSAQLLRAPRWMEWHEGFTRRAFDQQRREAVQDGKLTQEFLAATNDVEKHFLTDSQRLISMIGLAQKGVTIFASMSWTLVEFSGPLIATSDQPMFVWPLDAFAMRPQPMSYDTGLIETLEVRMPVSPNCVLLMTWSTNPADDGRVVAATEQHSANANALSIANADRDWFSLPGTAVPPHASGHVLPLSMQLLDGYNAEAARTSPLRSEVASVVNSLVGVDRLKSDDVTVVSLNKPSPTP